MVGGAISGAVTTQAVNSGIQQVRNPESFLNQALKYLAIAVLILSILLGVYLVANWGFLKDNVIAVGDLGFNLLDTFGRVIPAIPLGGVIGYLNPFRKLRE